MNPHTLPSLAALPPEDFLKVMELYPKPIHWKGKLETYKAALLRKAQIEAYKPKMPERVKSVEELCAGWNC